MFNIVEIDTNRIIALRLIGRNSFHVKYIRLSYRIRGMVARIHTNKVAIIIVLNTSMRLVNMGKNPVKKTIDKRLIIKILAYSAIKINANIPLLYSTLNPDTNSDSPSAKSNGVRLVSARFVINHIIANGEIIRATHDKRLVEMIDISIWEWRIKADSKMRDILTSYEMVWATPRRAPNRAYLELEHHPARKVEYTFILDTHKKYKAPNVINIAGLAWG